jgi:hypothetical protein
MAKSTQVQTESSIEVKTQGVNPKFKSRVPVDMMIPKSFGGIRVPISGVWEVRNNCVSKQFTHGTDEITSELAILPIGITFGYGLVPPFSSEAQVFKAFTDPNGRRPEGFNKDWFRFDDANKVIGINNLKGVIQGIFDGYVKEWVYVWFLALDNFGSKLPENVLCALRWAVGMKD